jgi:hypothetical protein
LAEEELLQKTPFLNLNNISMSLTLRTIGTALLHILGYLLIFGVFGTLVWIGVDSWRIRRMSPALAIQELYTRLQVMARYLEVPYQEGDTPYEFLSSFIQHIDQNYRKGPPMTDFFNVIRELVNLYIEANYAPDPLDPHRAKFIVNSWGKIRLQLNRFWINKKIERFLQRQRRLEK